MLFDVAALLVTSVALSGLTGAMVVPETPRLGVTQSVSDLAPVASRLPSSGGLAIAAGASDSLDLLRNPAAVSPDLTPIPKLGSAAARRVDPSLLSTLGARALLDQLALLPSRDIASFVSSNPQTISRLLLNPPTARSVASWWALIPDAARSALTGSAPELVGNLDGLPATLRDGANRAFLAQSIAELESGMPTKGRAERAAAEQRLHMLNEIEKSLVSTSGQPKRELLSVDTAWPGRAAVVIGDLATADFVSYMVPGMFFTTDRLIVDWAVIAQDLYDQQADFVTRLGRTDPTLAGKSVATVAWIGYQTPGILDIASLDLANAGAKFISSAVQGVQATRTANEPFVTLVTHSYGSTATLIALADRSVTIDSLVIIGSPGGAAQSVADLGMSADRVFVGEAAWDPVVNSAFFGSDPGADSFGARSMSVAGGMDPITGNTLGPAYGHLGYFDVGSEAMRNMALVGLNRGDLVTGATAPSTGNLFAGLFG